MRREFIAVGVTVAVVAVIAALVVRDSPRSVTASAPSHFSQVLAKGELRCSYLLYSPYFRRDANTGELSGVFHDLMEEIGRKSSLKIVWAEEVGYENIFPGLDSGRFDVFAGGLWPNASRAKAASFTIPVFYSVIKAWGRNRETRFTNLVGLNSKDVRIATIDGAMEDIIAHADYSEASRVSLPQLSPFTLNLLNITTGKADVTFAEPGIVREFLQANPGALKELAPSRPLRIFGNSLVVRRGDVELREFLDIALAELLYSGFVDRILQHYEPGPGVFPRVALPYRPDTAVLEPPSSAPANR